MNVLITDCDNLFINQSIGVSIMKELDAFNEIMDNEYGRAIHMISNDKVGDVEEAWKRHLKT